MSCCACGLPRVPMSQCLEIQSSLGRSLARKSSLNCISTQPKLTVPEPCLRSTTRLVKSKICFDVAKMAFEQIYLRPPLIAVKLCAETYKVDFGHGVEAWVLFNLGMHR